MATFTVIEIYETRQAWRRIHEIEAESREQAIALAAGADMESEPMGDEDVGRSGFAVREGSWQAIEAAAGEDDWFDEACYAAIEDLDRRDAEGAAATS